MSVRPTSRQYLRCIPPHGISPHGRLNADRKSATHAVRTTTCQSAQFRPEDGRRHTSGFVSPKITVAAWIHSGDIIRNHRSADNGFRYLCTGTPNPKTPANPQQVAFRRLCCRSFAAGIGRSVRTKAVRNRDDGNRRSENPNRASG